MNDNVVICIILFLGICAFFGAVWGVVNFICGIINFNSAEYICAKCGKHVTKKAKRCPKCKESFEE